MNGGVHVTGLPIPQKSDGFHYNIYRLAVDGLDAGPIYQISYKGQKAGRSNCMKAASSRTGIVTATEVIFREGNYAYCSG